MRCTLPKTASNQAGFTLIEMLVIAPLVVLMITGFIAIMIGLTGDTIISSSRAKLAFDTQAAIDRIEQDVRITAQFVSNTGPLPSPEGRDNGTQAFTASANTIVLQTYLTTNDPNNPRQVRNLVYTKRNSSDPCDDANKIYNRPSTGYIIYFTANNTLWRRTVLVPEARCDTAWQRNSCSENLVGQGACSIRDERILEDIASINFTTTYLTNPDTATSTTPERASTLQLTMTAQKRVAGATLSHQGSLRATKINNLATNAN